MTSDGDMFDFLFDPEEKDRKVNAHSFLMEPVYSSFEESPTLAGVLIAVTAFENLFDRLLPDQTNGVMCVVTDSCGNAITYELNGPKSTFLENPDLHDPSFDEYRRFTPMELYHTIVDGLCVHDLHIYPSSTLRESYNTSKPAVYTSVVALAFFVTTILLVVYDITVTRRQEQTMRSALRSGALVDSLFPANVRDRVMEDANTGGEKNKLTGDVGGFRTRPIADFFPNTTLMCKYQLS